MSLRINTNVASLMAQREVSHIQNDVEHAMAALASGKRIVKPSDDAAGHAISEMLRGQENGIRVAKQNTANAIAFIQVAEGGLNEQNNLLVRLRELALQASSGTVTDKERGFIESEFRQLVDEFDRIASTTQFGTKKLLVGQNQNFEFQVGAQGDADNVIKFNLTADTTSTTMGLDLLSIVDQDVSREALADLDRMVDDISGIRAKFGGMQSRLQVAADNLQTQLINTTEARSIMADADVAEELSNLTKARIQKDFAVSILAQANQNTANVGKLV